MTVNKNPAISPVFAVGFEKFFHGNVLNYLDKLKMIGWNSSDITCKNKWTIVTNWIRLTGPLVSIRKHFCERVANTFISLLPPGDDVRLTIQFVTTSSLCRSSKQCHGFSSDEMDAIKACKCSISWQTVVSYLKINVGGNKRDLNSLRIFTTIITVEWSTTLLILVTCEFYPRFWK